MSEQNGRSAMNAKEELKKWKDDFQRLRPNKQNWSTRSVLMRM